MASVEKRREYLKQHSIAKGLSVTVECHQRVQNYLEYLLSDNPHTILPEYAVSQAVYLVAHHPDFTRTNSQKLDIFKELVAREYDESSLVKCERCPRLPSSFLEIPSCYVFTIHCLLLNSSLLLIPYHCPRDSHGNPRHEG